MTLSASPALSAAVPRPRTLDARHGLDALSRQGREDMLDLIWAAWFASRPERTKELLIRTLDDGPEAIAGVTTAAAMLTLMRLRTAAAGDPEVTAIVDGLLEEQRVMQVPRRLRRVLAAGDEDRSRALVRVRVETGVRLPRQSAETISAVIGYLVGTELDPDGTEVREVPEARGFSRSAMSSLGLPFGSYTVRMRDWL
jgi:hypothetical protein